MRLALVIFLLAASMAASHIRAATIDQVKFLPRIEPYQATVNTTLVTQEGKRIPIDKGTRVNVAGFTATEAFIISRTDRPNGFIRRGDLAPLARSQALDAPRIKEETIR
jgi:hypothetical protein